MRPSFCGRGFTGFLCGLIVWVAFDLGAQEAGGLRAGAARSNITPALGTPMNGYFNDRRAAHIHDDLYARCLVLEEGSNRVAIVICDSCMIPRPILDAAKKRIKKLTELDEDHILIASTHTHTAPAAIPLYLTDPDPAYCAWLPERIADGVARAIHNLEPARLGWAVGRVPGEVFNRRWKLKPGTVPADPFGRSNDVVKMNPAVGSADLVEPAGPIDPEVSIVAVQTLEGRPIAVLANYSLHYVGTGKDDEVSADYFGAFAERFEELIGAEHQDPPFVAMLSNGTSGDINNINFRNKVPPAEPYQKMRQVADRVAREAHRVYGKIRYQESLPVRMVQEELTLGVRKPGPEDLRHAEQVLKRAQGRSLRGLEEIYARETQLLEQYPDKVPIILQAIRLGDVGIAAIPCEVFAEIGLSIKSKTPFRSTFTIELANGCNGYLPTPEQHKLGGYETWRARSSYLETEAAPKIISAINVLLERCRK